MSSNASRLLPTIRVGERHKSSIVLQFPTANYTGYGSREGIRGLILDGNAVLAHNTVFSSALVAGVWKPVASTGIVPRFPPTSTLSNLSLQDASVQAQRNFQISLSPPVANTTVTIVTILKFCRSSAQPTISVGTSDIGINTVDLSQAVTCGDVVLSEPFSMSSTATQPYIFNIRVNAVFPLGELMRVGDLIGKVLIYAFSNTSGLNYTFTSGESEILTSGLPDEDP